MALNVTLLNFSYTAATKSVHRELLEKGVHLCTKCNKASKIVVDFRGHPKTLINCEFCEKLENSREIISIWILCGPAGSGKTSLFNALTGMNRPVGNGAETKTLNSQTISDCLEPLPCHHENKTHLLFVDSEGTNGVIFDETKEQKAQRYMTMLKNAIFRANCGITGVILCLDANSRMDQHTTTFLDCLSDALAYSKRSMNLVVCLTKCNNLNSPDKHTAATSWYNNPEQSSMREYFKKLNGGTYAHLAVTYRREGCEHLYLDDLFNKLSELRGASMARGETFQPTVNINMNSAEAEKMEKKAIRATNYVYERNPVLLTLFGTTNRVILSAVFSPILLALSPIVIPAVLYHEYNRAKVNAAKRQARIVNDASAEELLEAIAVEAKVVEEEADVTSSSDHDIHSTGFANIEQ